MRFGTYTPDVVDILDPSQAFLWGMGLGASVVRPTFTGIPAWDEACFETGGMGLGDWWYVVVGGASNSGKTALARHLLQTAALGARLPSLISLETPRRGLQRSIYATISEKHSYGDMLPHAWAPKNEENSKILRQEVADYRAREESMGASMYILEHRKKPTLEQIMQDVDALAGQGSRLIILDHMQLVKSAQSEIAAAATEVSESLREYAHDKQVCIVALSQLNRTASVQRDRTPTMHDLWGGTSMESNANQVLLIDHSRTDVLDSRYPHLIQTWLVLDKNREGPSRVEIPVEINYKTGLFRQADPREFDDWPNHNRKRA